MIVNNLLLLLLFIFGGIALLAFVLERTAKPMEPGRALQISRWIYPLVGLLLVLSALKYFLQG
jgi:heme/copper-type cytochrome/quinol oxidase subunit 1